jgi:hypothetical protein
MNAIGKISETERYALRRDVRVMCDGTSSTTRSAGAVSIPPTNSRRTGLRCR